MRENKYLGWVKNKNIYSHKVLLVQDGVFFDAVVEEVVVGGGVIGFCHRCF